MQASLTSGAPLDREDILKSISYLRDVAATVEGSAEATRRQRAARAIHEATLQMSLKSTHSLGSVVNDSIQVRFPGTPRCEVTTGKDSVRRAQLKVDISLMLWERNGLWARRHIRWGWADSSPQGGFEWLLWRCRMIAQDDLMIAYDALKTLCVTEGGSLAPRRLAVDDHGEGEAAGRNLSNRAERRKANEVLAAKIREHLMAHAHTRRKKKKRQHKKQNTGARDNGARNCCCPR